jgi:small GTP-binding protein
MGDDKMTNDPSQSTIIFPFAKVVIAGDVGVGKSSLIRRYCVGTFEESRLVTTGMDFQIKIVQVNGSSIKLSIWDIAGQERFGAFRDTFYLGAKVVALVYDLANPTTLDSLPRWHSGVAQICPKAKFVVVGNKLDLGRRVMREQVEEWARSMGLPYMETSALTSEGVDSLFQTLAELTAQKPSQ